MTDCSIKFYNRETGKLEFSFNNANSSITFDEVMNVIDGFDIKEMTVVKMKKQN